MRPYSFSPVSKCPQSRPTHSVRRLSQTEPADKKPSGGFRISRAEPPAHSSLRSWRDSPLHTLVNAQQIKLDALSLPVQLGSPPVAWARVELDDGVRVLTLSETNQTPPSAAAAEEPHLFFGLYLAAVGISLVHTANEELVYLCGRQFTLDLVQSQRTATFEAQLMFFQVAPSHYPASHLFPLS